MTEEINNQEEVLEQTDKEQELVEFRQLQKKLWKKRRLKKFVLSTKTAMIKQLFDKVNGLKKEEVSKRFKDLLMLSMRRYGWTRPESNPLMISIGKKKK